MTTIAELLPDYTEYLRHERRLAESTITSYRSDLVKLSRFIEMQDVEIINLDDMRAYLRKLSNMQRSGATVRRKFAGFGTFWRWMRMENMVTENIIDRVTLPRPVHKLTKWMSKDELRRFVDTPVQAATDLLALRNKAAFLLLAWFGLRRGELLVLKVYDVLPESIIIHGIKNRSDRLLPTPLPLRELLAMLALGRAAAEYLLPGDAGGQWDIRGFEGAFHDHLRACGLSSKGYTPHTLRHSVATHLVREGVNLAEVQQILGHAAIASTMQYVHVDPSRLRRAMDAHVLNHG